MMEVLFFALFPDEHRLKEGMSQRMLAVDNEVVHLKRTYLYVSHRLFVKPVRRILPNGAEQICCNVITGAFIIISAMRRAGIIYFHSVQNVLPVLPYLTFIPRTARVYLDIHGVVPEEHAFVGSRKARWYAAAEKSIFKRLNVAVAVTRAMEKFYRAKYPAAKATFLVRPILPANITTAEVDAGIKPDDHTVYIYSGNLQKWQNAGEMFALIKEHFDDRAEYIFLTGEPDGMQKLVTDAGLQDKPNVTVASVTPSELRRYYSRAHYGFVLRDDILVNRVACPTKLVEYMNYGIIPIVKSPVIGDFEEMGYDRITAKEFTQLPPQASLKNVSLIATIKSENTMPIIQV